MSSAEQPAHEGLWDSTYIFHYSFWNFCSQIEKRKLICHNLFWNKSKNRALSVLELALQIGEDAKAETGFTIRYGTWSWSRKDQRHYSMNHFPIRIETQNKNSAFKLDTGCHEGLRFANLKLDRFSPGWRSQGQWAWCGRGIEVSTIQRRLEASI